MRLPSVRLAAWVLPLALFPIGPKTPAPAEPPAAEAPAAETPAPEALLSIELPTLARTLESDRSRVRSFQALSKPSSTFLEVQRSFPEMSARLAKLDAELLAADPDQLTYRELDLIRIDWLGADTSLARWETALESDAKVVDDARNDLTRIESSWRAAFDADWYHGLPPGLLEKIDNLVIDAAAARESLNARTSAVLVVQDDVSAARARAREAISRTFDLSAQVGERMFAIEKNSLWAALSEARPSGALLAETSASWHSTIADLGSALEDHLGTLVFQIALFFALVAASYVLVRHARSDTHDDLAAMESALLHDRPYAAAFALALFSTFFLYPPTVAVVRDAALALFLIPYFRLAPRMVAPSLRVPAYGLGGLVIIDRVRDFALAHSLLQRLILLLLGVLGVAWWLWAHRVTVRADASGAPSAGRTRRVIARVATAFLAVAVVANVVGNVSLAEQLTVASVKGVFAGALLLIIAKLLESLYVLLLRLLRSLGARMVVRNEELLERRGRTTIRAMAVGLWIVFLLWIMRIIEQSGQMAAAIVNKKWMLGNVQIGVGGLIAFATALAIGVIAARILRFILDEAVFPRMSLPRGVPAAISTTVGYLVVIAGLVMAFLAAGLEMSQFTFLVGAFGVGIGFGLQNVVNNFVSGLILLYERPIQVGDVLTVGTLQGRVRRIGIRSSTLATFDGAEVIVPNATLIATDVVNWTLSDRTRRVDIAVGVAYGSDPAQVLATLQQVANAHREVLPRPVPTALFMGFGESSLSFELRVWTPDFDSWVRVGSELRTAIFAAFKEAKIEIPFPQRDLHLKMVDPAAGGILESGRSAESPAPSGTGPVV